MNQSFKTNQLLRIVDDVKMAEAKPQANVVADTSKTTTSNAKRESGEIQKRTAESGLVQK